MFSDLSSPALMTFCEASVPGLIRHPAETWTNVGPLLAGLWILGKARLSGRPELRPLGWVAIFLATGSALYHASGLRGFEILDLASMYVYLFVLLGFALNRFRSTPKAFGPAAFAVATVVAFGLCWGVRESGVALFALTATVTAGCELWGLRQSGEKPRLRWLAAGILAVGLAFAAWWADTHTSLCNPANHWLSLHGVWHLLNALPFFFFYRHYAQTVSVSNGAVSAPLERPGSRVVNHPTIPNNLGDSR